MTTGTETITLVNGNTYTLVLDHDERMTEALGEVPDEPTLTDVMAFSLAAYRAIKTNKNLSLNERERALRSLRQVINDASMHYEGKSFFPHI